MSDLVCEHGSFRRKCEICERDDRIKELEEAMKEVAGCLPLTPMTALKVISRVLRAGEGWMSDCERHSFSVKNNGIPCPFCRAERAERAEALVRRCAIELSYVHSVENCNSGLCASSEGADCIESAEALLGPMRQWPELRGEDRPLDASGLDGGENPPLDDKGER